MNPLLDSATGHGHDREVVRLSEVLAALSFALDLTDGQPVGHAMRSSLIGLALADRIGLPAEARRDLYYALLLKDVGGSSQSAHLFRLFGGDDRAAQHDLLRMDWTGYLRVARFALGGRPPGATWFERARRAAGIARGGERMAAELIASRCEQGAAIVERLGFGPVVAEAVRASGERWDGQGTPRGLSGQEIPVLGRIVALAQTLEVFLQAHGPRRALQVAQRRSGRWFDPALVLEAHGLEAELARWRELGEHGLSAAVRDAAPPDEATLWGADALDRVALGFAEVVDAKSPFTAQHSRRMSAVAVRIGRRLGFGGEALADLRRAGLLHDIGKLSVPNAILDKPGPLDADEWEVVRLHPYWTLRILLHVRGFKRMAQIAASHHERLDGRGYFRGLGGTAFPIEAQILAAADQFDALITARPYRPALEGGTALRLLERERDRGVSGDVLDALAAVAADDEERLADAA